MHYKIQLTTTADVFSSEEQIESGDTVTLNCGRDNELTFFATRVKMGRRCEVLSKIGGNQVSKSLIKLCVPLHREVIIVVICYKVVIFPIEIRKNYCCKICDVKAMESTF